MEIERDEFVENAEHVMFYEKECYVYMIPPRKSSASYRADEWNVNKWAWEGAIKVVSKGEQCVIRLEDRATGELYAQAPIREEEPVPIERVIDSSRYFVLRIEDNSSGKPRHAFIGIGFRERPQAYDFEAALDDHIKYLNKKKHAEEMIEEYKSKPSGDYSLKDGETIHLSLKTPHQDFANSLKSKTNLGGSITAVPLLAPPPLFSTKPLTPLSSSTEEDDDFGDFQAA